MAEPTLRVCALYPELMNIYADRGNLLLLEQRCRWRGIGFQLRGCDLGEALDPDQADLFYMGGGQDRDQRRCAYDLVEVKRDALWQAAERGAVILAVCGGYQLLGHSYQLADEALPGLGLLDARTVREPGPRLIGNVAIEVELDPGQPRVLAGFENHGGRTYLGPGGHALGRVIKGFGNNGKDGLEGGREGSVIGTYLHGPLLPKNAWLADWLIGAALNPPLMPMPGAPPASSYDGRRSARPRMSSRLHLTVRLLALVLGGLAAAGCGSSGTSSTHSPPAASPPTTTTTTTAPSTTTTPALPGAGKPPVTIGDKNYTEQFVLGQLYYQALKAQGFSVTSNPNIGPDQVRMQQLQSGLFMYPEYLNVWNSQIAASKKQFTTLRAAYRAAQNYALRYGLELLDPTPFSDTVGIGATVVYAQQNHLRTIGDLAKVAAGLTMGGPPGPQFQQAQADGLPALEEAYGFAPAAYKSLDIGDQYKALDEGIVQAAYVNTTDGEFTTGNYQLLLDTKGVFGVGNVVPVMSAKTLDEEGPVFADTIDRVSALLSLPVIRELNALVDLSGETPAGVASRFLADHGLIPPSSVITS